MVCCTLLLVALTSLVCGVFLPHSVARRYQAQENSSITVEWCFSPRTDISVSSLKIHCVLLPQIKVFYHLDHSVEEPQDEQFAGRVLCDKDALSTGRVRLHLCRVTSHDSGVYLCRMATESGRKVEEFSLNITAAVDQSTPVRPDPGTVVADGSSSLVDRATAAATVVAVLTVCR